MIEVGVSTATDITGFGLIGHLYEVLSASGCSARLYSTHVPFFEDAVALAKDNVAPGGTKGNLSNYAPLVTWSGDIPVFEQLLLNDAQTSGGLLIFVPSERREALIAALRQEKILAAYIGEVIEGNLKDGKRVLVER